MPYEISPTSPNLPPTTTSGAPPSTGKTYYDYDPFPSMPMKPEERKVFWSHLIMDICTSIQHDIQREKEASRKLREAETSGS